MKSVVAAVVNGRIHLKVRVVPGSSKNQVVGLYGEAVKIKVAAPPEDGKANAELCEFVAELLSIAKSKVEVVSGHTSRSKTLAIDGVDIEKVRRTFL